jgi:hypothetical protein
MRRSIRQLPAIIRNEKPSRILYVLDTFVGRINAYLHVHLHVLHTLEIS